MFTIHEEYQMEKDGSGSNDQNETKEETKMEITIENVGKNFKKIDFSWNKEDDAVMEQNDNLQREGSANMVETAQGYNNYNMNAQNEIIDSARSQSDQVNSDNDEGINKFITI